jgi:hypothetical protein
VLSHSWSVYPVHSIQSPEREPPGCGVEGVAGDGAIRNRFGLPPLDELVMGPPFEQVAKHAERATVTDDENALSRPISKDHPEEEVYPCGDVGQTLATRRPGEETAEGVPVSLKPRESRFGLPCRHVVGPARVALTKKQVVPHLHGLTFFGSVRGEQVLGGLLRSAVPGVVDVVEKTELRTESTARPLGLATALVRDRHMVIGDALHRLPRFVIEEEGVALLRDVPGRFGVSDQDKERGSFYAHFLRTSSIGSILSGELCVEGFTTLRPCGMAVLSPSMEDEPADDWSREGMFPRLRQRLRNYDDTEPGHREDFLKVAGGFAEEAQRQEAAGDLPDAAQWWRSAAACYREAGRVAPDDVSREGHLGAAAQCERLASELLGR